MKKNKSVLLSVPYILWMLAFTLIPLGVVAYYALTDAATGEFTLDNMNALSAYLPVLWESICYALISALICLLLGYPVAYFIAHRDCISCLVGKNDSLAVCIIGSPTLLSVHILERHKT